MFSQLRFGKIVDRISYIFLILNIILIPLILDKNLSNFYIIPKQYVFGGLVLINILFWVLKIVLTKKIQFTKTMIDKPIIALAIVGLLSAILSVNANDSFFGRSEYFTLNYIIIILFLGFYYAFVNFVKTEKMWRGILDSFLAVGLVSLLIFILKTLLNISLLTKLLGQNFNTIDQMNSVFGVWAVILLVLSFGQLIKKNMHIGRIIFSLIFIVFGTPKFLQMPVPTEVALGLQSSWSIASATTFSGVKEFLVGSGLGSFGVDFSKFRNSTFNLDSTAWSLRFNQPYNSFLSLLSEGGVLLVCAIVFIVLLVLGHVFTVWNKIRASSTISSEANFKNENEFTFENTPQYSLSFSFGLIVIMTGLVMSTIWGVRLYLGEIAFAKALASSDNKVAEIYINDALSKKPKSDVYHSVLAQIYLNQAIEISKSEKPDVQAISTIMAKAVNEAKYATDIAPKSIALWESLATMYENASALVPEARDWALKALVQARDLEPTNPSNWWRIGNNFAALTKWDDAIKNYEMAIELKPDYYGAYVSLSNAYEQTKKTDKAIETFEKIVEKKQVDPETLYNYGRLIYNRNGNGDRDLAEKIWLKVISLQPNYSNALYSLGLLYETRGDKTTALQYFYKVKDLNPNNKNISDKIKKLLGSSTSAEPTVVSNQIKIK